MNIKLEADLHSDTPFSEEAFSEQVTRAVRMVGEVTKKYPGLSLTLLKYAFGQAFLVEAKFSADSTFDQKREVLSLVAIKILRALTGVPLLAHRSEVLIPIETIASSLTPTSETK